MITWYTVLVFGMVAVWAPYWSLIHDANFRNRRSVLVSNALCWICWLLLASRAVDRAEAGVIIMTAVYGVIAWYSTHSPGLFESHSKP